jgi:hypothetical protein
VSARFALASEIALVVALSGCGALLGLDEYYIADGAVEDDGGPVPADGGPDGGGGPPDGGPDDAGVNQPPTLRTVALSTYRPIVGETVVATAGRIDDPEDDRTSLHFQWFADGVALDGRTSSTLAITGAIDAGTRIHLEAWARDTADGPRITIGPIDVIAEENRWRALEPSLEPNAQYVYDALHHRLVYVSPHDQSVWEYSLDRGRERWAKLFPGNAMPAVGCYAGAAYDPVGQRMLVYGGAVDCFGGSPPRATGDIVELDLRIRGGESWSVFTPGGGTLPPRLYPGVAFLPADGRLYFYGGVDSDDVLLDDVWALTLERGEERWDRISVTAAPRVQARLVAHPTERVLYAIAGGAFLTGTIRSVDTIQRIDVTAGAESATELSARLPEATSAPVAVVDSARRRAIIGFGLAAPAFAPVDRVSALDLETEAITELTPGGSGPASALAQVFEVSDTDASLAYLVGGTAFGRSLDVYAYDLSDDAWDDVSVLGVHRPPGRHSMSGVGFETKGRDEMRIWGGRGGASGLSDLVWIYDGAWRSLDPLPDTVTGNRPVPRSGIWNADNSFGAREIAFAGGLGTSSDLAMTAWQLVEDRWLERTLRMAMPLPPPRSAAAYFDLTCGIRALGVFGGSGLDDTWFLECSDSLDRDCVWIDAVGANTRPSGRSSARAIHTGEEVLLYGGAVAGDATGDIFTLDPCATLPTAWTPIVATGGSPPPRAGHTLTRLTPPGTADPPIDIIVIGGSARPLGQGALGDVWRLQRRGEGMFHWAEVELATDSEPLVPRADHVAVLLPGSPVRIWVFGGQASEPDAYSYDFSDVWELRLPDPP